MNARRDPDAALFLVGFMGVGKSTVGEALAARLGWEFEDTDALVVRKDGRTIETIFRESGEGRFRDAEWDVLHTLSGRKRLVVATGGGLFLGVAQRAFVRSHGMSCWLDAPLSVVLSRVSPGESRPLLRFDDAVERRVFFERRRAVYALADCRIDASAGSADELAGAIESVKRSIWR